MTSVSQRLSPREDTSNRPPLRRPHMQPYTWRFSPPDADGNVTLKMTVGAKPVVVTKQLVPKQA